MRAHGSAQLQCEDTAVLVAVHGPLIVGGRREDAVSAVVEVIFKPFNGRSGARLCLMGAHQRMERQAPGRRLHCRHWHGMRLVMLQSRWFRVGRGSNTASI